MNATIQSRAVGTPDFPFGVCDRDQSGALRTNATLFWVRTRAEAEALAERNDYKNPVYLELPGTPSNDHHLEAATEPNSGRWSIAKTALIVRAAELLEESARELTKAHTVNGEWPDEEFETLAYVKDIEEAAKAVRVVAAGGKLCAP